ncbi:AAA family ATPase [Amycolatopsis sp. cmx-8-4]|uniref:AAA family ATPase n=1 Tax=Amycolatopsis sp. cmx-8-4 TaxID=2790947 RepID=UPI00397B496A
MSDYMKIFDPPLVPEPAPLEPLADRSAVESYVYEEGLVLAVNVALATRRPLLVRGRPGTGKSSLARNVAMHLRWRFYPRTVSSRTRAQDLLWEVDEVARLSDASAHQARPRREYLIPGVLWWAYSPVTAAEHRRVDPNEGAEDENAVVLLDEIDKAEPDVPNDLLEPLGLYRFRTDEGDLVEAASAPLVVLTTNEERDLPKAFLRRCVVYSLPMPTHTRLRQIAAVRFGPDAVLYRQVTDVFGPETGGPADVSVAEYLDAVAAARKLGVRPGHPLWEAVLESTTSKQPALELR